MSKDVSVRTDEQTWWQWLAGIDIFEAAKRFWSKLLDVLRYYVTQLADELVEIVSRGIMLVTPFPNAVSLYKTTQVQLGFTWYEAAAFAMTIEFIIFFLIEIALLMLSRWLDEWGNVYKYAFWGMVIVVCAVTAGVVLVVYNLEPHKILAAMPGFSLAGFIAIGLRRWDKRNEEKRLQKGVKTVKRTVNFTAPTVKSSVKDFTVRQQAILQWLEKLDGKPAETFVKADLMRDVKISRPTLLNELEILQSSGALNINGVVEVRREP